MRLLYYEVEPVPKSEFSEPHSKGGNKMKNEKAVKELLEVLGGKENIANYEHCATRLRVILKDDRDRKSVV